METMWQDLKYAARMLRRSPGFTVVAVLAVALGVGVNAAMFSVVDAVLLRPLGFTQPGRLICVFETEPEVATAPFTSPDFLDYREQNHSFAALAGFNTYFAFTLTGSGEPERLSGAYVSPNFFDLVGIKAAQGRTFMAEEERAGKEQVVVLSHGLWQRRFGGASGMVGQEVTLNGARYTVVGILPAQFPYPFQDTAVWVPLASNFPNLSDRGSHWLQVVGRLKPGVSLAQAQTEMDGLALRQTKAYPDTNTRVGVKLIPWQERLVGGVRPALLVLFGAVGFVLLIACVNAANLLLARATARQKEMAVRGALGATRGRLARQLLTENLLLALLGGAAGMLLAVWSRELIIGLSGSIVPRVEEIRIDWRVAGFAAAISLVTGLLFGLAPAFEAMSADLNKGLKESWGTATAGRQRMRNLLAAGEVALSLVLLVGAGLTPKSLVRLSQVDAGFNAAEVLTMEVSLPSARYPSLGQQAEFYRAAIERVETLPGVEFAAMTSKLPILGGQNGTVRIEGQAPPAYEMQGPLVEFTAMTPGFFRVMGIPLMAGRALTNGDTETSLKVAVINRAMAERFWPGESAVGKRFSSSDVPRDWREVVGVVGDVRQWGLTKAAIPEMYLPLAQMPAASSGMVLTVRAAGDARRSAGGAAPRIGERWRVKSDGR